MRAKPPSGQSLPRQLCRHCGRDVPAGDFCGNCGGHLVAAGHAHRTAAFAAFPTEHLYELTIVTTLFPHLLHRHSHAFRRALLVGGALFLVLSGFRFFAPATVVAALLLPVLYLLYLYEVEVYQDEPVLVIGSTFVTGLALGLIDALLLGPRITSVVLSGNRVTIFLVAVLVAPLLAQALMLAGPALLLTRRRRFNQGLDGLTFGAASALGFSLATMMVTFWPILVGPVVVAPQPLDWGLRLLREGVLVALVNASTTGVIAAAAWLLYHGRSRQAYRRPWLGLLPAVVIALGAQIGLAGLSLLVSDLLVLVLLWAAGAAILLLYTRIVIHHALLDEGREDQVEGAPSPCPECGRTVPTMRFCPACGVARTAVPRQMAAVREPA